MSSYSIDPSSAFIEKAISSVINRIKLALTGGKNRYTDDEIKGIAADVLIPYKQQLCNLEYQQQFILELINIAMLNQIRDNTTAKNNEAFSAPSPPKEMSQEKKRMILSELQSKIESEME